MFVSCKRREMKRCMQKKTNRRLKEDRDVWKDEWMKEMRNEWKDEMNEWRKEGMKEGMSEGVRPACPISGQPIEGTGKLTTTRNKVIANKIQ